MPTLTIKGMPDALYRRLKRRAAEHRRSLNGEILHCLERATAAEAVDPVAFLARVDALRERVAIPALSEDALRRAKSAGRP